MYKSYPADRFGGTIGIKLPMNSKTSREFFNMSYNTEEQSVSNFVNLLMTKQGERFMQPEFGVGLPWYLFEQNTVELLSEIDTVIRLQAAIWLPYITIYEINIKNDIALSEGHTIGMGESILDQVDELPDSIMEAVTRDYSDVVKKMQGRPVR